MEVSFAWCFHEAIFLNFRKESKIISVNGFVDIDTPLKLKDFIVKSLTEDKIEDLEVINLHEQTSILADYMVIGSGRSSRQVISITEKLVHKLNLAGLKNITTEGTSNGDWVVTDAGDVIIHIFRPEVRDFYNIEKMWRPHNAFEVVSNNSLFG